MTLNFTILMENELSHVESTRVGTNSVPSYHYHKPLETPHNKPTTTVENEVGSFC